MKKTILFLGVSLIFIFFLVSCGSYNITIQFDNGKKPVDVGEGESFELTDYEVESKIFLGCYSSDSSDTTKYVDSNGKSIAWKENYPTSLVPKYIDIPLNFSEAKADSIKLGYAGSQTINFVFDEAINKYVKNNLSSKYEITVKFDHYEKKTNIIGLGASNWSDCSIYIGSTSNVKSTDQLESNSGYKGFSRTFTVNASEFTEFMVGIKISRPAQNVSTQESLYKDFSVTIKETLNGATDVKSGYTLSVQSDVTLKPVIESSITKYVTIEESHKKSAKAYGDKNVKVTVMCENYGAKDSLGVMENWANLNMKLKSNDSIIAQKQIELKHTDSFKYDNYEFTVTKENFMKMTTVELNFWYDNPTTFGGNHSSNWYYIRNISVILSFNN